MNHSTKTIRIVSFDLFVCVLTLLSMFFLVLLSSNNTTREVVIYVFGTNV